MMAPLVALMRSATAMLHEASTTNRIRLAALRTRTLRWKSSGLTANATRPVLRCSPRCPCRGAGGGGGGGGGGGEGEVVGFAVGGPGLNVAAPLAVGAGAAALAALVAGEL